MRRLRILAVLAAAVGASFLAVQRAQAGPQARDPAVPSTAAIGGRVTDRTSGQPLAGVAVTLGGPQGGPLGGRPLVTQTDADGRYAFAGLRPGPYSLTFAPPRHRASHLPHVYGERQPLRPRFRRPYPISLRGGQRLDGADVALWRALAISGRVTDEHGEPLVNIEVHAFTSDGTQASSAETIRASDDRGAFRIFGLPPGRYFVCAEPRNDWQQFWRPVHAGLPSAGSPELGERPIRTCHVSALSETEAEPVNVSTAEMAGVEIRVRRSRTFTVTGTIVTSSGAPLDELRPQLSVTRVERGRADRVDVETTGGGRFVVRGLVPGEYVLSVDKYGSGGDGGERETARVPFRVEASDIAGMSVVMHKPARVVGRVIFEEPPAPRQVGPMRVIARQNPASVRLLTGPSAAADVKTDLSFELAGLFGPQVLGMTGLPRDYFVKSIRYREQDITDVPVDFGSSADPGTVEILLSRRGSFLTGTVVGEDGLRADDVVVLLFPVDPGRWKTAAAVTSMLLVPPQGPYTVGPVRAGEYLVVALRGEDTEGYSGEPAVLEALARIAERVVLTDNERRTLDLRVAR